jgi:hypothetical protein
MGHLKPALILAALSILHIMPLMMMLLVCSPMSCISACLSMIDLEPLKDLHKLTQQIMERLETFHISTNHVHL